MFIKKLELVNFQVIKEFTADFNGNVYFVTGDNELGKSTLLKAIGALLTGERDDVLRNGEEKGFAKMVIGDDGEEYDVNLTFTKANPRGTLTIKSKSTGMSSTNVSMLQKVFGYQDFDAVEFSRWSETAEGRRKQIAVVKNLLPEQVRNRIDEIDNAVTGLKNERTGVNRDVKTYTTICEQAGKELAVGDLERYAEPIDVTDLMREQAANAQLIEKAKTVRATLAQRNEQLAAIPARMKAADDATAAKKQEADKMVAAAKQAYEAAVLNAKNVYVYEDGQHAAAIAEIEKEKADIETRKANCENWLAKYEANNPQNTDAATRIAQAQEHNRKAAIVADFKVKQAQRDAAVKNAADIESKIGALADERVNLINNSELPIAGLSFTDDGLELNGVPFVPGKVSDSQIMEIAAKLIIASNPTVKVFRIARGESLGEKRLQTIIDIAKKNGFQGFIEQVQRGQTEMAVEEYTER